MYGVVVTTRSSTEFSTARPFRSAHCWPMVVMMFKFAVLLLTYNTAAMIRKSHTCCNCVRTSASDLSLASFYPRTLTDCLRPSRHADVKLPGLRTTSVVVPPQRRLVTRLQQPQDHTADTNATSGRAVARVLSHRRRVHPGPQSSDTSAGGHTPATSSTSESLGR